MERINVEVDMIFTLDKSVYTSPKFNWPVDNKKKEMQKVKNFKTFFDYYLISQIDLDYPIIVREANRTPENKEAYKGVIKFLETVVEDIRNSVEYTVLSDVDNVEKIQARFNFGYYENSRNPEQLFKLLVITAGINRYKGNLQLIEKTLERVTRQEVNMEVINDGIKQFEYIVSFFENIHYTLAYKLNKKEENKSSKKLK